VTIEASEPLWQVVVGNKEPWRRGRLFLILFAIFSALVDLFAFGLLIFGGYLNALLFFAAVRSLFWLQYYFIWIGVHWVRWFQGGLSMLQGFAFFVWSFENQSGPMMLWGMFSIAAGAYLGFAPSVHFFATRQKENRQWLEAIAVAAVFGLLLASLASGVLGLFRYQAYLQMKRANLPIPCSNAFLQDTILISCSTTRAREHSHNETGASSLRSSFKMRHFARARCTTFKRRMV
jgi:hypothetical protein